MKINLSPFAGSGAIEVCDGEHLYSHHIIGEGGLVMLESFHITPRAFQSAVISAFQRVSPATNGFSPKK